MADEQRRAGVLEIQIDGEIHDVAGDFEIGMGVPKRETMIGPSGWQGYTETHQAAFIAGDVRDRRNLDVKAMLSLNNATITARMANGKVYVLRQAAQVGEGTVNSGTAAIPVRFEGASMEEIR